MDISVFMTFMAGIMPFVVIVMAVVLVILILVVIHQGSRISSMKRRYRKLMAGSDGESIEKMLMQHLDEVHKVVTESERINSENQAIRELLDKAITRVGVIRFRAFDDMGSDLSYAVALLDSHNNGVVLSSIFGRDDSRSYVKPIQNGQSSYKLTEEEEQALYNAVNGIGHVDKTE